jgi:hypothetical protein
MLEVSQKVTAYTTVQKAIEDGADITISHKIEETMAEYSTLGKEQVT